MALTTSRTLAEGARMVALVLAALALLAVPAPATADATATVTFDDQPAETRIENQYRDSHGVAFPQSQGFRPLVKAVPTRAHSGSNVAIYQCDETVTVCGEGFPNPVLRGVLVTSASSLSAYVGWYRDLPEPGSMQVKLRAFNGSGTLVGESAVTVTRDAPLTQQVTVTAPSAVITSFELVGDQPGAALAFDDLSIVTPDTVPPPDFTLNPGEGVVNVLTGTTVDVPLDFNRINGSNGDVSFAVSGLPAGMTAAVEPNPVPGTDTTTTLKLTAAADAVPSDQYTEIRITATPGAGAGSAPRTITKLVRIRENCERGVRMEYVDARASGCMTRNGRTLSAHNLEVRINGLIVRPADDSRPTLVIDQEAKTIKGRELTMPFLVSIDSNPDIPIYAGPIDWKWGGANGGPAKIVRYDNKYLKKIKKLPIQGFDVSFLPTGKSQITPTVSLNFWPFKSVFGGITTTTQFVTDNDGGADFTGLDLRIGRVDAVAVDFRDIRLHWHDVGGKDVWSGSANVLLKFAGSYSIAGSFQITNGNLDHVAGSVGGLNIAVGGGVFLHSLGFEIHDNPLILGGSIGLTAGPSVAGASAIGIDGGLKFTFGDPWVIQVNGSVRVAGRYTIGGAYLRYISTGLLEFGGALDISFWRLSLNGRVDGWVAGLTKWNLDGSVNACLDVWGPNPCASAKVVLSTNSMAGCVGVYGYYVGAGTTWDPFDPDAFTGCDLAPYRETRPRQAGAPTSFTLPGGLPLVAWEIKGGQTGEGRPGPGVTLTGPSGAIVEVSQDAPLVQQDGMRAELREDGTTFVLVKQPAAGTWKIVGDGTVPIAAVRQARALPRPVVRATVAGKGRNRILGWKLKRIAGQRVTLLEVGKDVRKVIVADVTAAGSRPFRPGRGSAGKRRIVALVEQNGFPRAEINAGRYVAPPPLRPAKPQRLRVTRKGTNVTVRFRSPPAGFRHGVYFQLSDGRKLLRIVGAKRRAYTLRKVGRRVSGRVTVRGLTALNAPGPKAKARLPAAKKP